MTDRLVIKGNTTKERIIQTAIGVFSEKGFHETRMEEIAERASVAKGTIYLYFRTKKELFSSLFSYTLHLIEERITKANRKEPNPRVRLENVPRVLLEILKEKREFFRLIFHNFLLMDPESRKIFEKWKGNMIAALSSDIQKIAREKSQASVSILARIIFYFLLSLFLGFLTGDLEIEEEKTMREIQLNYCTLLGVI
ncbi:MAG: TetR/AcrR family transcriptional regulator [Caldiserica bacterium]|jgi:AcrR family transcriptional regulator|nr:TetR/AcrR family transcriptional regulator [Caldisericota bacterium]